MLDFLKSKVASYLVKSQLRQKEQHQFNFTNFFKKSFNFFVIMPVDDHDFHHSFELLNSLEAHRKNITIFTYDFRVSLLPLKFRNNIFECRITDQNNLKLPSKYIVEKLSKLNYDVVLDLNRTTNLYCSYAANLVNASVRAGFSRQGSDKYYNLQIVNNEDNPDISYKNFLNCLSMF